MCVEEEIELLECELIEIKSEEINHAACKKLLTLIKKCNRTIKGLKANCVDASSLRKDFLFSCIEQVLDIKQKAQNLIDNYYQISFSIVEL